MHFGLLSNSRNYSPIAGDRCRHVSRGIGIVGDCSDYQYCYFTNEAGDTAFVCKENLSLVH